MIDASKFDAAGRTEYRHEFSEFPLRELSREPKHYREKGDIWVVMAAEVGDRRFDDRSQVYFRIHVGQRNEIVRGPEPTENVFISAHQARRFPGSEEADRTVLGRTGDNDREERTPSLRQSQVSDC